MPRPVLPAAATGAADARHGGDAPRPAPSVPRAPRAAPAPDARPSGGPAPDPLADRRLRPGLEVLWRGNGELQLGSDPRSAVRLADLDAHETRWLTACAGTDRPALAVAARHGVAPARARALIALLAPCGVLTAAGPEPGPARRGATAVGAGAAESPALGAVHADEPARVLARRAGRVVVVTGLGRTGAGIATALCAAGVGTLVLRDARPVQTLDVGPGGLRLRDVGRARDAAVAQHVQDTTPTADVRVAGDHELAAALAAADLVVTVEERAVDVARATRLLSSGTVHLPVVLGEAGAVVGPLVVPGETTCLRCVDLHRRDADDRWPTMAVQLRQRYTGSTVPEDTATATVAAGVAVAQALAHLDGLVARARATSLEIDLPQAVPRARTWAPHPSCGCGAQ